ncbi:ABC transporter permease [Actinoalloteichus spitiensis]|uniref:ABC transporter permease n=1 Tax=Actinoalloteichus spitiensis TaxID=252394 RepID=UPI00036FFF86|nr:ABC transporter permease [Actinoalloteichus spitiensis]
MSGSEVRDGDRRRTARWRDWAVSFLALVSRDVTVLGREVPSFLAQTVLQPFLMLLVLGTVLTDLGYLRPDYPSVLLPGIVALTAFLGACQHTTLNLVFDFSYTREIDDRLLAPAPTALVALAKVVTGALRGLVAAVVVTPVAFLTLGTWWSPAECLVAFVVVLAGSGVGAALGMVLGTAVEPSQISATFAVVVIPLSFTGATHFPWPLLAELRWFQVVSALNPLTYVSESLRGAVSPEVPHLSGWISVPAVLGLLLVFGLLGVRGFRRRAIR